MPIHDGTSAIDTPARGHRGKAAWRAQGAAPHAAPTEEGRDPAHLGPEYRRQGCRDHGIVALHHHPDDRAALLDRPEYHSLDPALGSLSLHPAQSRALIP